MANTTQVNLDWNDNTEANVAYHVYRGTTSGFAPDDATNRIAANLAESRYVDDDVPAAGVYYYKLKAVVPGVAESAPTSPVRRPARPVR